MEQEILRLFKGYIGEKTDVLNVEALQYGLLIPKTAPEKVVKEAIKQYGKDGVIWNQTFHKDWKTMAETPMATLILEQIVHYITTYGFEELGIYNESTVYIPAEKLEVPELDIDKIRLTAINAYTADEVSAKLMTLITSGIALSTQTVKDIETLSDMIDKDRFDEITNREVRTFLYDKYKIMPKDPEAFLRYLIYKATGATLKIQNVATYRALAQADKSVVLEMLKAYGNYAKLSSIFLRNKNLFLALKSNDYNKRSSLGKTQAAINTIVNKLRKLADKNHKPVKATLLASLTSATSIDEKELVNALDKVTLFKAVSLLNMLAYRLNGKEDIVYRVRNGKSYVSKIEKANNEEVLRKAYNIIRKYIVEKLSAKMSGKSVYIPDGFIYKVPTSEKQFVNNIPEGSYVELPSDADLIFGVHWFNLEKAADDKYADGKRVDLDLHVMNNSQHFGWNQSWRDAERDMMFSGDVTDACGPNGATELFIVNHRVRRQAFLATLNDFTCKKVDVPYEFVIAKGDMAESYGRNYMIDPNKIITKFNFKITPDMHQVTLGCVKAGETTTRFYFGNYGVGASGAVSRRDAYTMGALSYMETYNELQITLNDLLKDAGVTISDTAVVEKTSAVLVKDPATGEPKAELKVETVPVDIDLSPEALTKDSLISLLS